MCCTKKEKKWLYKPLLIVELMKLCNYGLNGVKEVRNSFLFFYYVFVDYCLLQAGQFCESVPNTILVWEMSRTYSVEEIMWTRTS